MQLRYVSSGFTLIELSIVLVIIGLVVGGILTGQDLINTASIRAQISQIEKYNTAARTFQGKYGYLPGDIPDPYATNFGFPSRGTAGYRGEGDGNGEIEGVYSNSATTHCGICNQAGETIVFWVDLSKAGLIDNGFSLAGINTPPSSGWGTLATDINDYLPPARTGNSNYIYVYSGGYNYTGNNSYGDGLNYYGLSAVNGLGAGAGTASTTALSVIQAYNIDKKTDDGLPQSGKTTALYANSGVIWAGSGQPSGTAPYTTATAGSATTCFDNSATSNGTPGVTGAAQHYSVEIKSGTGANCGLSFTFQ